MPISNENYFSGTDASQELEKMKKIIEKQQAELSDERVSLNKNVVNKNIFFKWNFLNAKIRYSDFQCLSIKIIKLVKLFGLNH